MIARRISPGPHVLVIAGDTPVLVYKCDVTIYKAPQKGMTEKLEGQGFLPEDFSRRRNPYPDGKAYFGIGERGKAIAQDYASRGRYDGTVLR